MMMVKVSSEISGDFHRSLITAHLCLDLSTPRWPMVIAIRQGSIWGSELFRAKKLLADYRQQKVFFAEQGAFLLPKTGPYNDWCGGFIGPCCFDPYPFFTSSSSGTLQSVYDVYDRRKFRSQTSDNMERWKSRWEESGRRSQEVRRSGKRKSEKQEDAGTRKARKVTIHGVFRMIWGSGGSKSSLAKAAGAEPAGQMRDEKLPAVVARSTFPSQMYKAHQRRITLGSWDVEKVHVVVARSTSASQNVQSTPFSDNFFKLRCRKSARRCGAKHVCKSKCTKHTILGPLVDVQMSKKWTLTNLTS